jgi:hypothetical protein
MKQKIAASAIAGIKDFAAAAASHAAEMKAWRAHMARVKQDEKNAVPIERRHVAYPRPRTHPLVERAVDEYDEVNFEIVDDGPTATEKLASRKMELIGEVSRLELAAVAAAVPIGKRRLYALRENDIRMEDAKRRAALLDAQKGFLSKITGISKTAEDIEAEVEKGRPAE